ncbi:MAG: MFS transporter [Actinomycetota bacterium]|nr:MFS transporter [Actinomycetota bacterium]
MTPDAPHVATGVGEGAPARELRLHGWADRTVVAVASAAFAAGFGQFGLVAALGDVARHYGRLVHGASIADQVGLSGTELGIGLAVVRLASLGSLPLIGLADRLGRRRLLVGTLAAGLALTAASAASPGYWWFVAIFAAGRPLLSATNALAQVAAGEQTSARTRASAVALTAGGYGVGAGVVAFVHSLASGALGFRGMFALALVPLALVPVLGRFVEEPDRFAAAAVERRRAVPVLGAVGASHRRRVAVLCVLAFAISVVSGPANSFVYLYAQDVVRQPGYETAIMVVGAGVSGLAGLLAGRWLADRVGRRPTAVAGTALLSVLAAVTYSGSRPALVVGYVLGVLAASLLAPAAGALLTELFPTEVRASAAGWWVAASVAGAVVGLVAFGAVADVGNRFAGAAAVTFLPVAAVSLLFYLVPETRGREPEDLWPSPSVSLP